MPAIYTYSNPATLRQVAADLLISLTMDDPIFQILPIRPHNRTKLRWKIKDNPRGLTALRGLGGEPSRVNRLGEQWFEATPGIFGEYMTLDEGELMNRGGSIPEGMDVPISVNDMIMEDKETLMQRYVNRLRQMGWVLLLEGTQSISLSTGGIGYTAQYDQEVVTPAIPFTTLATAIPLREFQKLQETYGRGSSTVFDNRATAWMNSKTSNLFLNNTNAADLGGKRVAANGSLNSVTEVNRILLDANVPQIRTYDGGYLDDDGNFQIAIPDNRVIVVGARPNGETPGEFQLTKNVLNSGDAPGVYSFVDDRTKGPNKTVPPRIDTHCGFNGGHAMTRPGQIIKLVVGA